MTIEQTGNWRCFFWHKWRRDPRKPSQDYCGRPGCGVVRPHKDGTKE